MKTAITFFILLFTCFSQIKAQQQTFSKIYGDSSNATIYSIREVENDGFLLFGSRSNPNTQFSEQGIIKTNNSGNEEFIKYLGSPDFRYLILFEQDKDNNYITAEIQNEKVWDSIKIKHLSQDFKVTSTKVLPIFTDSFWNGYFSSIYYLPGQGFLVSGYSKGNQSTFYLYLMDEDGNIKWHLPPSQSTFQTQYITTVKQVGNNILLMGTGLLQNKYGTFITLIDQSGFETGTRHFTYSPGDEVLGSNTVQLPDGNFLFTGHKNKGGGETDIMLVKMEPDLDTIWTKYLSSQKVDTNLTDGSQFGTSASAATQDGGVVMIINDVNRFGIMHDYVAKFDKNGNLLWSHHLDSSYYTTFYSIIETIDGGVGLAGTKTGFFHFLKLNSEGTLSSISKEKIQENKLKIYPNPSENDIFIQLTNTNLTKCNVIIYDLAGKIIKNQYNLSGNPLVLQREGLKAGIYLLKITDEQGNFYQEKQILK